MTNILDNITSQQQLDKENLYDSITDLNRQCSHAFQAAGQVKVDPKPIKHLIMAGMGGSGLAARVIEAVYQQKLSVPLTRINGYHLPGWTDSNSLVVVSSYSGTTEEIVQVFNQALLKKAQILVICAGGRLKQLAVKHHLPLYLIDPRYNPSQQPRMAIGYSIIGQLVMVSKTGLINIDQSQINDIKTSMLKVVAKNNRQVAVKSNPAKQLAQHLHGKQTIMVAAAHLTGAFHVVKNQMNENAKQLSHRHDIPELNHHLMEGLRFPASNQKDVVFWFINSKLYPQRIQTRVKLTKEVVVKNKLDSFEFTPVSSNQLSQVFEVIQFGALVNYYMTILNGINPAPVPWVDYFKTRLGQPLGDFK